MEQNALIGETSWPTRQNQSESCFGCGETGGQTGFWCLTGNGTNCQ